MSLRFGRMRRRGEMDAVCALHADHRLVTRPNDGRVQRGWHERRPELGDVDRDQASSPRAAVHFEHDNDDMFVRSEFWHPTWRVTGVWLPK